MVRRGSSRTPKAGGAIDQNPGNPGEGTGARRRGPRPGGPPGRTEADRGRFEYLHGRNAVLEAVRGRREVRQLWVAAGQAHDALAADLERARGEARRSLPPTIERLDVRLFAELVGSDEHQNVAAEVGPYPYSAVESLLAEDELILALDRVQDPHNLGAVIRTAEEVGAAVVIPRHRTAVVTPAVVRASAGATEHARVAQVRNLGDFLVRSREHGFWAYGAEAGAEQVYTVPDYRGRVIVVMGSEGAGLAPRVRDLCDQLVRIPLYGRVGSLNVSVAAGVLLFEVVRQRTAGAGAASPQEGDAPDRASGGGRR